MSVITTHSVGLGRSRHTQGTTVNSVATPRFGSHEIAALAVILLALVAAILGIALGHPAIVIASGLVTAVASFFLVSSEVSGAYSE